MANATFSGRNVPSFTASPICSRPESLGFPLLGFLMPLIELCGGGMMRTSMVK
jgi:hypothetical protein